MYQEGGFVMLTKEQLVMYIEESNLSCLLRVNLKCVFRYIAMSGEDYP